MKTDLPKSKASSLFISVSLLFTILFLSLTKYSMMFSIASGVMVWYAPAGLNIALLLVFGLRYAPVIFVAGFLGGYWILAPGSSLLPLLIVAATTPAIETLAVFLFKQKISSHWEEWNFQEFSSFVFMMTITPLFVGIAGIVNYCFMGMIPWIKFSSVLLGWWIGDVIGMLTVTPFILFIVYPVIQCLRLNGIRSALRSIQINKLLSAKSSLLQILGQMASIPLVLWFCFLSPLSTTFDLFYFCFLPLIWIVFSHGLSGAVLGITAINIGTTLVAAKQIGGADIINFQLFMAILSFTGIIFGKLFAERNNSETALKKSNDLLDRTQRIAHVGGWEFDLDTKKLVWTDEVRRMHEVPTDYEPEVNEAIGFYHTDDAPIIGEAVRRAIENGESYDLELRIVTAKGNERHIRTIGEIQRKNGRFVRLQGMIQDITKRKQVEEALRFTQYAVDKTIDQAFWMTEDGGLFYVNDAACQTLGYSRRELLKLSIADIDTTFSPEKFARHWRDLKKNGYATFESFHRAKDGRVYPVEIRANHVVFDGREYRCAFATDITERKRMEQSLRQSEGFQRTLLQTIPDLIWLKDTNGAYLACNAMFERFFGAREEDIVSKTDYDFVEKNVADLFREHDRKTIAADRPTINEEWITFAADGHRVLLETIKTPMFDNQGKLIGVLGIGRDISERKKAENALRESEERFRRALENIPDMVVIYDSDLRIKYINEAATILTDRSRSDFIGKHEYEIWPQEIYAKYMPTLQKTLDTGCIQSIETELQLADNRLSYLQITYIPLLGEKGNVREILGITHDLTEQKEAEADRTTYEAKIRQSQKLESIGRLAGGVAHDFNNMLSVILGYGELAMELADPSQQLHAALQEIILAAQRSADITRQLLAFARKQAISPKVLDINKTVAGMNKMLQRLIGENIDLAWFPGEAVWPVMIDPGQIDQILANLCVNARDAISDVGKVTIETDNVEFNEAYCSHHLGSLPGEYVLLAVSDNGCGMDAETLDNIFEPFFTTKESGKGTGLGLATVYGIVNQNKGYINVYSEPGQGTTFKIYLPRHRTKVDFLPENGKDQPVERGYETILLVEDESAILGMTTMMLERLGYRVVASGTPGEAIRLAQEYAGEIHLLVTDVIMPEMNGRDLAKRILSIHPHLKCLFMSGYTANVIAHHGVLDEGVNYIQKPFLRERLGAKVREALDEDKV